MWCIGLSSLDSQLLALKPPEAKKALRALLRIEKEKARGEKDARLGEAAGGVVKELIRLPTEALTALAIMATGAMGYPLGFILVHYAEKIVRVPHGSRWVVKGRSPPSVIGYQPRSSFQVEHDVPRTPIYGPIGPEEVLAGPYETLDDANRSLSGINPDYHPFIVKYANMEGLLTGEEAEKVKLLLGTAAAAGIAGSALGALRSR